MNFISSVHQLNLPERSDEFAQHLYAGLCNQGWQNSDETVGFTCSWRHAGSIVADARGQQEIYLDFYCSGDEGTVFPEVAQALAEQGWFPCHHLLARALEDPDQKHRYLGQYQLEIWLEAQNKRVASTSFPEPNHVQFIACAQGSLVFDREDPQEYYLLNTTTGQVVDQRGHQVVAAGIKTG